MTAIGYVRVSTEDQAREGVSLDAQREKIRAYCRIHDIELAEILADEGISGKKMSNRPALQQALEACRRRYVDTLIVTKLDRLSRKARDALDIADRMRAKDVRFVSIMDNLDTATIGGRLVFTIMAGVAEWERETIGERTSQAVQFKLRNGHKTSSVAPYGFRFDGKAQIEDEAEQEVLGAITALRASGESTRSIAEELNRRGLQLRGRKWTHQKIHRIINRDW